ncbi:MAG: D-alanyl-D-alanine carboxypeptidase [bacterium]|nr:D-alanyl-D-alanine carboxypeptidase [bacterium]
MRTALLISLFVLISTLFAADAVARQREYVSAILLEAETGQLLFASDIDREWIPASVVKLMMLLLTEEAICEGRASLADTIIATGRAQKQGGSQVYLGKGERATLGKLIEATAVGSANDAIVAVAVALFGSVDKAVAAMNERAGELGMTSTHYVNVTGLPENRGPENKTTARDQARLAREIVLDHPGVLEWTSKTWTRFRRGLVLGCTNTLLKEYEGMDGLKTGYHHKAKSNLVSTAIRDGRRLIAVILGSPSQRVRNAVAVRLLDSGFNNWIRVDAMAEGLSFPNEFSVARSWNSSVPVRAGEQLSYLVHPEDSDRVVIRLAEGATLEAPLREGEVLGEILALLDGKVLATVPAVAGASVRKAWFRFPFKQTEQQQQVLTAQMIQSLSIPLD